MEMKQRLMVADVAVLMKEGEDSNGYPIHFSSIRNGKTYLKRREEHVIIMCLFINFMFYTSVVKKRQQLIRL